MKEHHFKKWLKKNWMFVQASTYSPWCSIVKALAPITQDVLQKAYDSIKNSNFEYYRDEHGCLRSRFI